MNIFEAYVWSDLLHGNLDRNLNLKAEEIRNKIEHPNLVMLLVR